MSKFTKLINNPKLFFVDMVKKYLFDNKVETLNYSNKEVVFTINLHQWKKIYRIDVSR